MAIGRRGEARLIRRPYLMFVLAEEQRLNLNEDTAPSLDSSPLEALQEFRGRA